MRRIAVGFALFIVGFVSTAQAAPITYIFSGTIDNFAIILGGGGTPPCFGSLCGGDVFSGHFTYDNPAPSVPGAFPNSGPYNNLTDFSVTTTPSNPVGPPETLTNNNGATAVLNNFGGPPPNDDFLIRPFNTWISPAASPFVINQASSGTWGGLVLDPGWPQ